MYLVSSCAAHFILLVCKFSEEFKLIRAFKVRKTVKMGEIWPKNRFFAILTGP